jgi:hypothetical protein
VSASVATPLLADPIYPATSFASPIYPGVSAGFSGGFYGGFYDKGDYFDRNGDYFDRNGGLVRNEILGEVLDPIIPGVGGAFSTFSDINVLRRAPDFIDSTINGRGYRRDPVGSFVRNSIAANRLGNFIPGVSASLNAFNRVNLLASLF